MVYGAHHITDGIKSDLEEILVNSGSDLSELVNRPLVITGASGFIGTWLTLSWVHAHKRLNGSGRLLITSRSPESLIPLFREIDPDSPVTTQSSDITEFHVPTEFHNGFLIHAATPASASLNTQDPAGMLRVIVDGQERVISEALRTNMKVLFLSSGAVYGRQPLDLPRIPENWNGAPDISDANSAYHEGKRVAELMGNIAVARQNLNFVSARLFAFLAPFLPQDAHFAAGNFIRDAFNGKQITITSGGGSIRSYLYATDLCSHLWALLAGGETGSFYNLGSEDEISILELGLKIASMTVPKVTVVTQEIDSDKNLSRYVPSIKKMRDDFGMVSQITVDEAIHRTMTWLDKTERY